MKNLQEKTIGKYVYQTQATTVDGKKAFVVKQKVAIAGHLDKHIDSMYVKNSKDKKKIQEEISFAIMYLRCKNDKNAKF